MPTNTYVALDKVTVGTATSSITFSSIPQGYTDLVIVTNLKGSGSANYPIIELNGDTGNNYSETFITGNGSTASSARYSNTVGYLINNVVTTTTDFSFNNIIHLMNYSNTTTYKTVLSRANAAGSGTEAGVLLWRNTSAISSITIRTNGNNWATGSTFSLYGIAATSVGAKATGGTIYSDDLYYYHVFGSTGTFTPLQSISADVLVVAGGGGGGYDNGGGGGAGGIALYSSQSLTATGYTCTVGGGGAGSTSSASKGATGGTSQFAALTSKVGGGGGGSNSTRNGANGASGGGGSGEDVATGGSATDGFAGAASNGTFTGGGTYNSGGGGGSSAAAIQPGTATATGGSGGLGVSTYSTWLSATGLGKDGFIAGGGGGASLRNASSGTATGGVGSGGGGDGGGCNTSTAFTNATSGLAGSGSGGGGGNRNVAGTFSSGNGGSGVVIVRYTKA
jgi:hypothetical protein